MRILIARKHRDKGRLAQAETAVRHAKTIYFCCRQRDRGPVWLQPALTYSPQESRCEIIPARRASRSAVSRAERRPTGIICSAPRRPASSFCFRNSRRSRAGPSISPAATRWLFAAWNRTGARLSELRWNARRVATSSLGRFHNFGERWLKWTKNVDTNVRRCARRDFCSERGRFILGSVSRVNFWGYGVKLKSCKNRIKCKYFVLHLLSRNSWKMFTKKGGFFIFTFWSFFMGMRMQLCMPTLEGE